jgi:hypothetical protein
MGRNTGQGYRKGAVTGRTQVDVPSKDEWAKRDEAKGDPKRGQFMGDKQGKPFKGVAKEPDLRRRKK